MKVCPVEGLLESGKYVLKKNPWRTMWDEGKVAYLKKVPEECILSKVPPWAHARGGLEARPEGVRAVNEIAEFIWDHLEGIHPGYRTAITEKVWARIKQNVAGGGTPTADDIEKWINEAIEELAMELDTTVEAIKHSGLKKYRMLKERKKTRDGIIATGKRLRPVVESRRTGRAERKKKLMEIA